ncbi:MAG: aminomethyltransferase beta-barrel domain-containing protein, partial [Candidatus Limnocylindria bacterium]
AAQAPKDPDMTAAEPPDKHFSAEAVLRYRGAPIGATVVVHPEGRALVTLVAPALVAPGQAMVWYSGDEVIGGGVVERTLEL